MPDISLNAVDGSQFSTTTISSQSTNQNKDTTVHFQTILDDSSKTAATSSGKSLTTPSQSTLNQIFQKASSAYGVDVDLLKAVARAESNFTANATSSAGAMGIMQLMPATAKSLGVTDPYDPEQNIMGGAKLLASHLKKYNGNVSLALAAYNCGSNAVDRYNGVPPYGETQNYIKKVLSYYNNGVTAPAVANTSTDNTLFTQPMTAAEQKKAAQEAALDRELADIPNLDLYLTSTEETDLTATQATTSSETTSSDSTATVTTSSGSGYSYEDYQGFVNDYLNLLSRLGSGSSSGSSDTDSYSFSPLTNDYTTISGTNNYNASVLNLLQNALTDQKKQ